MDRNNPLYPARHLLVDRPGRRQPDFARSRRCAALSSPHGGEDGKARRSPAGAEPQAAPGEGEPFIILDSGALRAELNRTRVAADKASIGIWLVASLALALAGVSALSQLAAAEAALRCAAGV